MNSTKIIVVVGVLAAIAQILQWAETSQWLRKLPISQKLPGRIFNLCLLALLGIGFWKLSILEDRLSSSATTTATITTAAPGLQFALWSMAPNESTCTATIDASQLSTERRQKYELALVCGFADPALDKFKDDRITISPLFTIQNAVSISAPLSKKMAEFLEKDQATFLKNLGAPKGMRVSLTNMFWFKAVLLPRGSDVSRIQRLSDVQLHGGEVWDTEVAMQVSKTVSVK